jgi:hypothetical protein
MATIVLHDLGISKISRWRWLPPTKRMQLTDASLDSAQLAKRPQLMRGPLGGTSRYNKSREGVMRRFAAWSGRLVLGLWLALDFWSAS